MAGSLIVTAEIGPEDFAWLNGLRGRHYPAERNIVPAHLTMFHAVPPSAEQELQTRLKAAVRRTVPVARIAGLMNLGGGVAFRIVSDDLDSIREELADGLHGVLGAQDARGWRPHVTIQNKATPKLARDLLQSLEKTFQPRPLKISGLAVHRYLGGPWETLGRFPFLKN